MMRIELGNCITSLTKNGQTYEHLHTMSVNIQNPVTNNLDSSPQGVGSGFQYRTGLDQPVTAQLQLRHLSQTLANMIVKTYKENSRLDFLVYDKVTGDQYTLNNAIIAADPRSKNIAEGAESFNVDIAIQCTISDFDSEFGTVEQVSV